MANVLVIKISGCPAQGVTLLPAHIIDTICKLPIVDRDRCKVIAV